MDRPLPGAFIRRMKEQFADGDEILRAIDGGEALLGLRINPFKPAALPWAGESVPWEPLGRILPEGARPGLCPLHDAGAYYLQEPSAMAAVPALDVRPGMRVFDACAAPGGKSGQIAARLAGQGLLISCETDRGRVNALVQNLERLGVRNALTLCSPPDRVASWLPGYFDRVLVDAPCSGEGMFRRHPETRAAWSEDSPAACARRQKLLLEGVCPAVKSGGLMVYSTCTYNKEENEGVMEDFLAAHPDFRMVSAHRILPHTDPGEGHFVALLRREEGPDSPAPAPVASQEALRKPWIALCRELGLNEHWEKIALMERGGYLCAPPDGTPAPAGLPMPRCGVQLAAIRKDRLEPAHALAMALLPGESARRTELSEPEAEAYLCGHTLPRPAEKGWTIAAFQGLSLGWGKVSGGVLKNHLPKGLRRR